MGQLLHVCGVISLTNSCLPPLGGPSLSTVRKLALAPKPPLHHRDHEHAHLLSNIEKLPVPIWDRSIPASSAESVPFKFRNQTGDRLVGWNPKGCRNCLLVCSLTPSSPCGAFRGAYTWSITGMEPLDGFQKMH